MIDHGADAATVVANATTDLTKGIMQISAAGLRQLFLLLYEGKKLNVGETNIERLIKAIDSSDKISDIKISKEHINQLVALSRKHGVTYAVAENSKDEMIVYFPESQANRMKNILSDMQAEVNKEGFDPEIKQSLYEEDIDSEKTIVWFDGKNPDKYVHISQKPLKEGGCETRCYIHRQDGRTELIDATTAAKESYGYEQRCSFEVEGLYTQSEIQSHINKLCADMERQRKQQETTKVKENLIDNLISKNASLDGTLYTITDAGNSKNMIAIYKHLQQDKDGEFKTVSEIMVFKNGQLNKGISPKEAIVGYGKYKVTEKYGKDALKQYVKIMNGDAFKDKEKEPARQKDKEKEPERQEKAEPERQEKAEPERQEKAEPERQEKAEPERQEKAEPDKRKTLDEYEKEVEKMRESMPKPEKGQNMKDLARERLDAIRGMDGKNAR
ncbi:MAG: procyclic acidic repetitive family protein [Eubacteriales bacterium]|nr:procyclic acidic repetitive family protein [Eubacteriales bacterium]